jgi:hypothetical protein
MKDQHTSSGDVLARELAELRLPQEEVQSGAHRDGAARPCGAGSVLLDNNTRHLLVLRECRDWEVPSAE